MNGHYRESRAPEGMNEYESRVYIAAPVCALIFAALREICPPLDGITFCFTDYMRYCRTDREAGATVQ